MTEAERLARRILECTEMAGLAMAGKNGDPAKVWDWEHADVTDVERKGLILTAQSMIDQGYVIAGPNL